nr:hypothetical protein [Tanacetum cinerariifolium]
YGLARPQSAHCQHRGPAAAAAPAAAARGAAGRPGTPRAGHDAGRYRTLSAHHCAAHRLGQAATCPHPAGRGGKPARAGRSRAPRPGRAAGRSPRRAAHQPRLVPHHLICAAALAQHRLQPAHQCHQISPPRPPAGSGPALPRAARRHRARSTRQRPGAQHRAAGQAVWHVSAAAQPRARLGHGPLHGQAHRRKRGRHHHGAEPA